MPQLPRQVQDRLFGLTFALTDNVALDSNFAAWRNFVLVQLIDVLQVLRIMGSHRYGWSISILDYSDVLHLIPDLLSDIVPRYSFLIAAAVLVFLSMASSYYMSKLLRNGNLQRMWPVKVLRIFLFVVVSMLFVSILSWLLMPIECISTKDEGLSSVIHNEEDRCTPWGMPEVLISIPSILLAIVFCVLANTHLKLAYEINPLSRNPMSLHTGRMETKYLSLKIATTVMMFLTELITPIVVALVLLILSYQLFIGHHTMLPYHSRGANTLRGGIFGMVLWMSLSSTVMAIFKTSGGDEFESDPPSYMDALQYGLLGALPLAFLAGFLFSLSTQMRLSKSLNRLRGDWEKSQAARATGELSLRPSASNAKARSSAGTEAGRPAAGLPTKRGNFERFFDVEWESRRRFASDWRAVSLARSLLRKRSRQDIPFLHFILKKAIEEHPESRLLSLFLLILNRYIFQDYAEATNLQKSLEMQAKELPLDFQFALFLAERRGTPDARALAGDSGVSGVQLLEFNQSMERARKGHMVCITKMRDFWRTMRKKRAEHLDDMQAEEMMQMLEAHEEAVDHARHEYEGMLERYPQSVQLLRTYAHFCDTVLNDYKEAEKRYSQAALLEGEDPDAGGGDPDEMEGQQQQLELGMERSTSTTEGDSYRVQVMRLFMRHREGIMAEQLGAVKTLHKRVWWMLAVLAVTSTVGFCVTDLYLYKDVLVKNIDLIDQTGLFRAYSISSNFLLRSAFLAAHANNTEGWARFTGNAVGAMKRLREQHFLNYDDIPSKRIWRWYHESEIRADVPVENRWERRVDHYWNVANDYNRRVTRAAETPMHELLDEDWEVGHMSEARAQVAYTFENTQVSIIPMFETMVKMYEDEVFSFGTLTEGLVIGNAVINSVLVLAIAFFVLRALDRVIDQLQSKYVLCAVAMAQPKHVVSALYRYYDRIEVDMKIVEDEAAERVMMLRQEDPDETREQEAVGMEDLWMVTGSRFGHAEAGEAQEQEPAGGAGGVFSRSILHSRRFSETGEPVAVPFSESHVGFASGTREREGAGAGAGGRRSPVQGRHSEQDSRSQGSRGRRHSAASSEGDHGLHGMELSAESQGALKRALKAKESMFVRREIYWVAVAVLLGMCLMSMVYPARRLDLLVNFAPTQNQAGRRRYLTRSCAHFARELVLQDGFSRMTPQQTAAALKFHLQELKDADRAVRMGGVHNVKIGADYHNKHHNELMYGQGCPWREDPEDCSTPDMPGRDDVNRNGLQYLLVSFYDAIETVLARYTPEGGDDDSMDWRTHTEIADVSEWATVRRDPERVKLLSADKDVKFVIAQFAGDVFNGLGGVLGLFAEEIVSVLDQTKMENRLLFALYLVTITVLFYLGLFRRTINIAAHEAEKVRWYAMMIPGHVLKAKDVHHILAMLNPAAKGEGREAEEEQAQGQGSHGHL